MRLSLRWPRNKLVKLSDSLAAVMLCLIASTYVVRWSLYHETPARDTALSFGRGCVLIFVCQYRHDLHATPRWLFFDWTMADSGSAGPLDTQYSSSWAGMRVRVDLETYTGAVRRSLVVPSWWGLLGVSVYWGLRLRHWIRTTWLPQQRLSKGLCPMCGYDISYTGNTCPECGWGREVPAK
jgi:hypothetical protein